MAEDQDEEVGYGKPPRSGQFRLRQSGNPEGRPKGAKNKQRFDDVLLSELAQKVEVDLGGKTKSITKQEALLDRLTALARKGHAHAIDFLKLASQEGIDPENADGAVAGEDAKRDMLDVLRRLGADRRQALVLLRERLREHGAPDQLITAAFGGVGYAPEESERRRREAVEQMRGLGVPEELLSVIAEPGRIDPYSWQARGKTGK